MSKENVYYLVARDRLTNHFEIIPIHGRMGSYLEEIDLYTTSFHDSLDLEKHLQAEGLKTSDTDFYIVNHGKTNHYHFLNQQEVLYATHSVVRGIAENSLHCEMKNSQTQIDHILDSFACRFFTSPKLREQVVSGHTNIYSKFVKHFFVRPRITTSIKYRDGGWARKSYPLIRNIVEAESRKASRYAWYSDLMYRDLLESELLEATDSYSIPDQLFIIDLNSSKCDTEKIVSIMHTFEKLPASTFTKDENGCFYNSPIFSEYEEEDLEKFQTCLPEKLKDMLWWFLLHRDLLDNASEGVILRFQKSVQKDLEEITSFLKNNSETLDKIYAWCQLYETYNEKAMDENGRGYQKRREN